MESTEMHNYVLVARCNNIQSACLSRLFSIYILVKKHSDETITNRRDLWKACKITRIRTDAHSHLRSVSDKESERCLFFIAF